MSYGPALLITLFNYTNDIFLRFTCENIVCGGLQSIYSTEGDENGSVTNIELCHPEKANI